MESKVVELIKRASMCTDSFVHFANFVNDTEFFAEQNPNIFKSDEMCSFYGTMWGEMEIINALALCEWEKGGKINEFSKIWELKYKDEAKEIVLEFVQYIKKLYCLDVGNL